MKTVKDLDLVYQGSVKDVRAWDKDKGPYYFEYSDRYSIFDWGQMPDELAGKGEALSFMANFFFNELGSAQNWKKFELPAQLPLEIKSRLESGMLQQLRTHGLSHHALGPVTANLENLTQGSKTHILKVKKVQVLRPTFANRNFDYSAYQKAPVQTLVPLEVVFRLGLPPGSSLLERLEKNPSYAQELNLPYDLKLGEKLSAPIIEFSTKLEPTDRYLTYTEAKKIAGLTDGEFQNLYDLTLLCALRLADIFSKINVELWDGKFEFAFISNPQGDSKDRHFELVDSIGPDELRLLYKGVQLSKEVLRTVYRKGQWYKATLEAKEIARQEGSLDWKKICRERLKSQPGPLRPEIKFWAQGIYTALANELAQSVGQAGWFKESPKLNEVMEKLKGLIQ